MVINLAVMVNFGFTVRPLIDDRIKVPINFLFVLLDRMLFLLMFLQRTFIEFFVAMLAFDSLVNTYTGLLTATLMQPEFSIPKHCLMATFAFEWLLSVVTHSLPYICFPCIILNLYYIPIYEYTCTVIYQFTDMEIYQYTHIS